MLHISSDCISTTALGTQMMNILIYSKIILRPHKLLETIIKTEVKCKLFAISASIIKFIEINFRRMATIKYQNRLLFRFFLLNISLHSVSSTFCCLLKPSTRLIGTRYCKCIWPILIKLYKRNYPSSRIDWNKIHCIWLSIGRPWQLNHIASSSLTAIERTRPRNVSAKKAFGNSSTRDYRAHNVASELTSSANSANSSHSLTTATLSTHGFAQLLIQLSSSIVFIRFIFTFSNQTNY